MEGPGVDAFSSSSARVPDVVDAKFAQREGIFLARLTPSRHDWARLGPIRRARGMTLLRDRMDMVYMEHEGRHGRGKKKMRETN